MIKRRGDAGWRKECWRLEKWGFEAQTRFWKGNKNEQEGEKDFLIMSVNQVSFIHSSKSIERGNNFDLVWYFWPFEWAYMLEEGFFFCITDSSFFIIVLFCIPCFILMTWKSEVLRESSRLHTTLIFMYDFSPF